MKIDIYLIRHGETNLNRDGCFQGQGLNPPLNENGLEQAKKLSLVMKFLELDAVYTSPLTRAYQTAEALANDRGLPLIKDERLLEANLGVAEGKLKKVIEDRMPSAYHKWRDLSNWDFAFDKGETRRQVLGRFMDFIKSREESDYKHIAVVTHAGVLRSFLASQGIQQSKISNTEIIHCAYEDGKLEIDYGKDKTGYVSDKSSVVYKKKQGRE
jgi:broad specificity phosphatase PhoE